MSQMNLPSRETRKANLRRRKQSQNRKPKRPEPIWMQTQEKHSEV